VRKSAGHLCRLAHNAAQLGSRKPDPSASSGASTISQTHRHNNVDRQVRWSTKTATHCNGELTALQLGAPYGLVR
jgi:hypothetical protein